MKKVLIILLIFSFALFLISLTVFPLEDADIWFQLKSGEWLVENLQLPCPDPFSWPIENLCWQDHEWGVQVLLHQIEKTWGLDGVIIGKAIVITLTFLILLYFQIRFSGLSLWAIIILTIGVIASADRFMERVEHAGFFFLVIFLGILFYWRKLLLLYPNGKKYIKHYRIKLFAPFVVIPILFTFWSNIHPTTSLAIVIFAIFLTGETIATFSLKFSETIQMRLKERRNTFKRAMFILVKTPQKILDKNVIPVKALSLVILVAVTSAVFSFITPYGAKPIVDVFKVSQSVYLSNLIEWQSPFAPKHQEMIYTQMFLLTFALYWLTLIVGSIKNGIRPSYVLLLAAVSYLGLTRVRHINVFVLVGFLPVMLSLNHRFSPIFNNRVSPISNSRSKMVSKVSLAYNWLLMLCILILVLSSVFIMKNGYQFGRVYRTFSLGQRPIFADKTLAFLDKNNINGNLFNGYGLGGYVIYKGYPERKVFMDGRAHYPESFFQEHSDAGKSADNTAKIMDKYKIDYIIILHPESNNKGLADFLSDDKKNWALIYWDEYYLVYVKRLDRFYEVISKNEYSYADPVLLRRSEKLEELARQGKDALRPKVRTAGELNRNLEENPDNNRARIMLGGIFELIPDIKEAEKQYQEVIRRDPNLPMGHFLLGNILLKQSQAVSGISYIVSGKESEGINATDSSNIQDTRYKIQDTLSLPSGQRVDKKLWEQAKVELTTSFDLDPTVSSPLVTLGIMAQQEGNLDQAVEYWIKATLVSPTDPKAYYQLGILYSNEQFDAEKAGFYLERFVTLEAGNVAQLERAKIILQRLKN